VAVAPTQIAQVQTCTAPIFNTKFMLQLQSFNPLNAWLILYLTNDS